MDEYKSILVTGGCGFLGRWLIKEVLDKYQHVPIKVVDCKPPGEAVFEFDGADRVEVVANRDICVYETIVDEFADIDVVFHLAGIVAFGIRDRERLYSVNIGGTKNVLRAAKKHKVKRVLHVSSVAALGYNNNEHKPVDEEFSFDWNIAEKKKKYYMLSKQMADIEVKKAAANGLKCVIVYPGLMYGPGDRHNTARVIKAIENGKIKFAPPGGTNVVDVRDVARGVLQALERGKPGAGYLLSGHNLRFTEIYSTIAGALNVRPPKKTLPRFLNTPLYYIFSLLECISNRMQLTTDCIDSAFKFRYFDNSRAGKELGWRPEVPFETTIDDTVKWLETI